MNPTRCPHLPPCAGCPRFGDVGLPGEIERRLLALSARTKAELLGTVSGGPAGYRLRARLAVRGTSTEPKVGLFQARSHHIVDIPRCVVQHRLINETVAAVKRAIVAAGSAPYHDVTHSGTVRYLQVVIERSTQRVQLVVVCNCASAQEVAPLLRAIELEMGGQLHSLWFNENTKKHNVILGPHWQHMTGPTAARESVNGTSVFYPPNAFGQSNLGLFEAIVSKIHTWVPAERRVLEYHAGVGAIGLGLVKRSASLDFVEIAEGGLAGLSLGVGALPSELQKRVTVHPGAGRGFGHLVSDAQIAIVDPPRKGLETALVEALRREPPERLIYLSCSLDSFERDTEALLAPGRLSLRALEPYALFPYTDHVETLALFERT